MILIIYSLDDTTGFLSAIPKFLQENSIEIELVTLESPVQNVESIIQKIKDYPAGSLIVFLGHGSSSTVYLPINTTDNKTPLIDKTSFGILATKNFISLSCKSKEFINKEYRQDFHCTMLGFDDLPTGWPDVIAQRDMDKDAYPGMTNEVLEKYCDILVDVFKRSLCDSIASNNDFLFFLRQFRLYVNKHIATTCLGNLSDNPTLLANILFDLKNGLKIVGDKNRRLHI